MARLIKDFAFVFITRLTQNRVFGQTKKCAKLKKKNKEAVRNGTVASKMTREAKCLASRVYLLIIGSFSNDDGDGGDDAG